MNKWDELPKQLDPRVIAILPKYMAPYFEAENLSGWSDFWSSAWSGAKNVGSNIWGGVENVGSNVWSGAKSVGGTIWKGVSFVPKKLYDVGYKILHYSSDPSEIATQGANDLVPSAEQMSVVPGTSIAPTPQMTSIPTSIVGSATSSFAKSVGGVVDDFARTVANVGGKVAGSLLVGKVAKATGLVGMPQKQAYNQALGWSYKHQGQLQQMGYPSPEAAASSALWANNGLPPPPDTSPRSLLGGGGSGGGVESLLTQYWWVPAGGILLLMLLKNDKGR